MAGLLISREVTDGKTKREREGWGRIWGTEPLLHDASMEANHGWGERGKGDLRRHCMALWRSLSEPDDLWLPTSPVYVQTESMIDCHQTEMLGLDFLDKKEKAAAVNRSITSWWG